MKLKTVKRLAILIVVLSMVGGTSVFTQRIQVQRLARNELEKAELALKKGNFVEAERLFREHLQVFPDDVEIQIKYADALLKVSRSPIRQSEVLQIYDNILTRNPGRKDVRRLRMNLKIEMKQLRERAQDEKMARMLTVKHLLKCIVRRWRTSLSHGAML